MQRVIELARVVRERHNRPIKTPLRELVVVHPDESFLSDIAGPLRAAPQRIRLVYTTKRAKQRIRMLPVC